MSAGTKWEVTVEEYQKATGIVSHSTLEVFRRSVKEYHDRFVTKEMRDPPPTEAMFFGTAFHLAMFQPEKVKEKVIIVEDDLDRRTKAGKEQWAAYQKEAEERRATLIQQGMWEEIEQMVKSAYKVPAAKRLLEAAGVCEQAVQWKDAVSGLAMKSRMDKVLDSCIIIDAKTCIESHPAAFSKAVGNFGYHRQDALYRDALAATGDLCERFYFIAVQKSPPYETFVYELKESALALGQKQNRALMDDLARRMKEGDWRSRGEGEVITVDLPRWSYYED